MFRGIKISYSRRAVIAVCEPSYSPFWWKRVNSGFLLLWIYGVRVENTERCGFLLLWIHDVRCVLYLLMLLLHVLILVKKYAIYAPCNQRSWIFSMKLLCLVKEHFEPCSQFLYMTLKSRTLNRKKFVYSHYISYSLTFIFNIYKLNLRCLSNFWIIVIWVLNFTI